MTKGKWEFDFHVADPSGTNPNLGCWLGGGLVLLIAFLLTGAWGGILFLNMYLTGGF